MDDQFAMQIRGIAVLEMVSDGNGMDVKVWGMLRQQFSTWQGQNQHVNLYHIGEEVAPGIHNIICDPFGRREAADYHDAGVWYDPDKTNLMAVLTWMRQQKSAERIICSRDEDFAFSYVKIDTGVFVSHKILELFALTRFGVITVDWPGVAVMVLGGNDQTSMLGVGVWPPTSALFDDWRQEKYQGKYRLNEGMGIAGQASIHCDPILENKPGDEDRPEWCGIWYDPERWDLLDVLTSLQDEFKVASIECTFGDEPKDKLFQVRGGIWVSQKIIDEFKIPCTAD